MFVQEQPLGTPTMEDSESCWPGWVRGTAQSVPGCPGAAVPWGRGRGRASLLHLPGLLPQLQRSALLADASSQHVETNICGVSEVAVITTWIISRRHSPVRELG